MYWSQYIVPVLLSAFTGWITTWIAVKMLFHPRRPINILGFKLQGIRQYAWPSTHFFQIQPSCDTLASASASCALVKMGVKKEIKQAVIIKMTLVFFIGIKLMN